MQMQLTRKLLTAFMALAFSALSANALLAEDGKDKKYQDKGKGHFEKMAKELGLTEQQKKDLQPILKKQRMERMKAMKAMGEKHNKELSTVLTPEQMEKLKEMRKDKMKQMHHSSSEAEEIDD